MRLLTAKSRIVADMMGERDCTLLWTICLVLAAMTGLTDAGWERVCSFDDVSDNQGVCGNQLARLLSLVCGVRGYAGVEKRTDIGEWNSYFFLLLQYSFISQTSTQNCVYAIYVPDVSMVYTRLQFNIHSTTGGDLLFGNKCVGVCVQHAELA